MVDESEIGTRFQRLSPFLNERTHRLTAAAEAATICRGGITRVARATGVLRRAIRSGLAPLQSPTTSDGGRIRRTGGGRRKAVATDATLMSDLERSIDFLTRGDRESPLRWTRKIPPGTSQWNKIEHRLFSFISQNWRGKPLVSPETIVNLIAATTTKAGLKVTCEPDQSIDPSGIKVSKEEEINLRRDAIPGEWNDTISPGSQKWLSIP